MAKFVSIRSFKNDYAREKEDHTQSILWPKKATNVRELTDVIADAHDSSHPFVAYYDEEGRRLKGYPTAMEHIGGKETLFGEYIQS